MSTTKAQMVSAVEELVTLAAGLPDDQSALIAQLTQERDDALAALATLKTESLAAIDELTTADAAEDAKRVALRAKFE